MHFTSAMHRIMCTLHILLSLPLFQHQHIGIQHSASLPTLQIACIHMLSTAIQPAQLAANSFNTGSKLEIFYVLGILHILFANRWVIIHLPSSSLYATYTWRRGKEEEEEEDEKKFSTRATKALAPSSPYILLGQKFVHRQTSSQLLIYGLLKNTKRRRKVI